MGKQINQSIVIDAKIKTTLEGMNDVVSKLNKGLREGTTKIDLTKGVGNSISKQIETFKTEYSKFIQLTKDGKLEFGDTKDAIRSGEQMVKTFSELKRIVGNFEDMSLLDAKKMFPDAFDSKIDLLSKKLNTLRENIVSLDSKKIELNDAQQALSDLTAKQQALQKELSEQLEVKIDTETAEQNLEEAKKKITELRDELKKELSGKLAGTESIKNSLETRKAEILGARKARGVTSEPLSGAQVKAAGGSKEQQAAASQALKLYNSEKAELKDIEEALKKNTAAAKEYRKALTSADSAKLTDLADKAESSESKINEITDALKKQEQAQIDLNETNERREQQEAKTSSIKKNLDETTRSLELQEQKVNKLQTAYDQLVAKIKPEELTKAFKELGIDFTPEMVKNEQAVRQLQEQLNALDEQDYSKLIQSLQKMGLSADSAEDYVKQLKGQLTTIDDSAKDISRAAQEMENLKNQVLQFFSITNTIQLFKRTVQSAFATVKELDAVMTETAVVTDFTIGDMWEKLPEYSAEATKLGASIRDLYGATTLYYQQGLQTEEAMGVGIETMKMARIANMDATDATKAMTAALRGFNMEVNETNAVRVNDVYSELAAITAADTKQIATAMSKTASIAKSANMEFETTAALLAQIIETTQEAPETAGTAMKTIIARFTEVKELFNEGMLTGEDSEGEEININKIDAALKTVGISLKDFLNGKKGIDDIFLELASKWDGLDLATQRYIATMAAGSRQQSRFIAMMSNYDRTMELVTAANNSAGASQEQFDKTLESMEAKLQKLKNAWDEFTMGLANNEILKFGVDLLTGFLETVNKLTDALSGGNGLVKSVISLVTVIGALKGGNALLSGLFGKGNEQGTGLFGKFFNKKKEGGSSNSSENQNRKQGEKDGKAYMSGWNRAVEQGKEKGFKAGLKGFFTQETFKKTEGIDQEKLLGNIEKKFLETDINSTLSDELATLHQSLEQGGISAEEAGAKFKKLGGNLQGTEPVIKSTSVDLQSVGQATMAVGGAVGLLSVLFENMGWEEGAEGASAVSAALVTLGGVLSGLPSVISFVGSVATATGISVQAAWIWVVGIVAVIGLIVGAVVAMNNAAKEKSLENRMKKAAEATKAAKETATQTREAYDNLLNEKNKYTELQKTLSGLTEGTNDWKMALIEANQQVLSLLSTYPVLAQYLGRGEDGQLIIQAGGWDAALEKQMEAVQASQASVFAAQIAESQLQLENAERNLQKQFKNTQTWKGAYGDVGIVKYGRDAMAGAGETDSFIYEKATMDQMLEADFSTLFSRGEQGEFSTELQELAGGSTIAAEELYNLKDALIEYKATVEATEAQMQLYGESLVDSITSEQTKESEFYDIIKSYFGSESQIEQLSAEAQSIAQQLAGPKGGGATNNNAKLNEIAKYYGVSAKMGADSLSNLRTIYAAATGKDESEVEDSLTEQQLENMIGTLYSNAQQGEEIGEFNQKLLNIKDDSERKYAAAVLTGDYSKLTAEEIGKFATNFKGKDKNYYMELLGYSEKDLAKFLGATKETTVSEYYASLTDPEERLAFRENEGRDLYKASTGEAEGSFTEDVVENWLTASQVTILAETPEAIDSTLDEREDKISSGKISEKTADVFKNSNQEENFLNNLTIGAQDAFAEKLQRMYLDQGNFDGAKSIANTVANVEKSELQQQLTDVLNTMDWTSITSIEQLDEKLAELGWTSEDLSKYGITELQKELEEFAKQSKYFTLDELKNQIKSTEELIKDIEGREYTERAFEKEDYEKIINLKPEMKSQFVMTGIDEFTYIGDSMQTLVEALQDNTAAELQSYGEQIKERGETSQKWLDLEKRGNWNLKNTKDVTESLTDIQLFEKIASGEINAQDFIDATDTDTGYNSLIEAMVLRNMGDKKYLKSLNGEELTTLITDQMALHYGDEGTTARTNVAEASSWAENQAYVKNVKDLESGQGLIVEETNTEAYKQQKAAIDAVALSTEGAMGQYAKWMDEMDDSDPLKNQEAQLKQLAIFSTKYASSVNDLAEALSDEIDVLKKGDKAEDKYWKALEKIAAKAQKVFGPKVNAEYVAANKDLFVQLAKGGKEGVKAFKQIANDSIAEYLKTFDKANLSEKTLEAVGSELKEADLDKYIQDFITTEELPLNVPIDVDSLKKEYGEALVELLKDPKVQELLKYNGMVFSTGADGKTFITKAENGSTGFKINNTGSGGSNSKWENPYDKLYNTLREINEELRIREQLERRYQKLIKTRAGSANELFQLSQKELEQLKKEADLQEELKKGRQEQIDELVAKKQKKYGKYVQVSEGENGEREIRINWDEINKIKGTKKGEALEEYISQLEEWAGDIEDANDTLDDIEDTVYEIEQRGREEYLDLEERIKDALLQSYQTQIDKLTDINDSINDTNSRLLDAMQESIAEQRQARENEKTEEDLADKQRRLAYLRQDTSGANALEIMQLEKELDEGMESYTDQLIDQKISELQKQNDEAAEQREKQIQIAQAQLEQYEKSGAIWSEVDELMAAYLDPNNGPTGKLLELLQSEEGFKGLSRLGKEEWMKDLKNAVAQAMQYVMGEGQLENIEGMAGQQITVTDKNGNTYTGTVDDKGNFASDDGTVRFKNVYKGLDGNFYTSESEEEGKKNLEKHLEEQAWAKEAEHKYSRDGKEYIVSEIDKDLKKGDTGNEVRALQWALKNLGYRQSNPARNFGKTTEDELKAFQTAEKIEATGILDDKTRTKFRLKGYKTGGLADFTGPAWLDGTKAHPEYILNAEQTKSFFELVDVLSGLKSGINTNSQITGDSIYDVDINVESIGSDYDVEQLAQTVKRMINDDARYRNNNAINLSR